ncbi:MAG: acyltransferase [Planctomycetota bacterium]
MNTSAVELPAPEPVSGPPPKTKRILELDALRALAAINLLLFHFTLVYQNKYGYSSPLGFEFPWGKYGVQLFFMLSGFVNAMTLLKKREPTEFLASRFIRILPSYWIIILINVLLLSCFPMYGASPTFDGFAANMTVMPELFGYECWEPVTWTLQVEMLFYAIILVLFIGGALNRPLRTVLILAGISGFGLTYSNQLMATSPDSSWSLAVGFLTSLFILPYLPLFGMGILLNEIRSGRGSVLKYGLGILACAIVFHAVDDHGHNPVITLFLLGLLTLAAYGKIPPFRWKPFMVISASSYALYLFHNNLGCLLISTVNDAGLSPLLSFALGIGFSFCFAIFYTYKFEQPLTAYLRRKWKTFRNGSSDPAYASVKLPNSVRKERSTS